MSELQKTGRQSLRKWSKRAGIAAFLFFLAKGLIWLALLAAGAYFALN